MGIQALTPNLRRSPAKSVWRSQSSRRYKRLARNARQVRIKKENGKKRTSFLPAALAHAYRFCFAHQDR